MPVEPIESAGRSKVRRGVRIALSIVTLVTVAVGCFYVLALGAFVHVLTDQPSLDGYLEKVFGPEANLGEPVETFDGTDFHGEGCSVWVYDLSSGLAARFERATPRYLESHDASDRGVSGWESAHFRRAPVDGARRAAVEVGLCVDRRVLDRRYGRTEVEAARERWRLQLGARRALERNDSFYSVAWERGRDSPRAAQLVVVDLGRDLVYVLSNRAW